MNGSLGMRCVVMATAMVSGGTGALSPRLSRGGRKVVSRHRSLCPSCSSRVFGLPELETLARLNPFLLHIFVPRRGRLRVFAAETIL